jgi:hypothetical protein
VGSCREHNNLNLTSIKPTRDAVITDLYGKFLEAARGVPDPAAYARELVDDAVIVNCKQCRQFYN